MRKLFIVYSVFFIALLSPPTSTLAQTNVLRLHPNNTRPIDGTVDYLSVIGSNKGRLWEVWSDRKDNNTHEQPDASSGIKLSINYLDWFYVTEENGSFIHLFKGDLNTETGQISNTQDYGWIEKKNMIIFPYCIQSKASITKKAILLNNIDTINRADLENSDKPVDFYDSPNLGTGKKVGESRLFEVFYVYKITPEAVLLGKGEEVFGGDIAQKTILGWADRRKVVFWDNRVAIEANWHEAALAERLQKQLPAAILDKPRSAQIYKVGQKISEDHIYLTVRDTVRKDGYNWRYPIFGEMREKGSEGILQVGAIGKVVTKGKSINPEIRASVLRKYEKARQEQKNINIVFVLDGTQEMKEHYATVVRALKNSSEKIQKSTNTVKFGCVVYRDNDADNDKLSIKPVTEKFDNVITFIENINSDYNSSTKGTALYAGLEAAAEKTNLNAKHTNILILVGTKGDNALSGVGEDDLTDLLYKKNCHLISIQARNGGTDTYEEFTYQMNDILSKVAQKRYEKYKRSSGHSNPPQITEVLKGEYQKFKLRNTAGIGELVFPNAGETLNSSNIEKEISQGIINANTRVNNLLDVLDLLFKGSGSKQGSDVSEFNASVLYFIIDQAELSEEEQGSISMDNFQGLKEGYAIRQVLGMEHPLFKSVLFLNLDELNEMYGKFRQLDDAQSTLTEQRKSLVEAWKALLKRYEGDGDFDELTMDEVNQKVFGLPCSSPLLKGLKLGQIFDIPAERFNRYVSNMKQKREQIKKILESKDYKYSFQSYGRTYYWIDEDLLP